MKQKIIIGIFVVAVIALISGATILAFASPGTTDDPTISLSYLTEVFKPEVMAEVKSIEQKITKDFDEKITKAITQINAGQGNTTETPEAASFEVVTLTKDQKLSCSIGTEIMLRIGTATANGPTPALVDSTSGSILVAGGTLTTNHMNLVTIEGNGITATAESVRIIVRGDYTISD